MSIENNNKNAWTFDKKKLLNDLALDIANEFWLDKEKTEKLIKSETLFSLDSLKTELKKEDKEHRELNESEIENLFFSLKKALNTIESLSKLEIKILKDDVEKSVNIEEFKNTLEKYLPPELVTKAKNPQKPHEHVLGAALWTANAIFTVVETLYNAWKGILLIPYHLYLIITWKWETNSFKNI